MIAVSAVGMAISLVIGAIAVLGLAVSAGPEIVRGHEALRTSAILTIVSAVAGALYFGGRLQQLLEF